jgi:N-acetylglucosaminyl-diphospho-decaprenol L-rhamnosyltransferase
VPKLFESNDTVAPSLRRDQSVLRALGAAVLGGTRAGRFERFGEVITGDSNYSAPRTAAWASGAAMLVSRECVDAVGPWDESFFLYSEETEFALRARDHGFALRYQPSATAVHLGGDAKVDPRLWALSTLNRLRLFGRRHGAVQTTAFRTALLLNELIRVLSSDRRHAAAAAALLQPRERSFRRLVSELGGPVPQLGGRQIAGTR